MVVTVQQALGELDTLFGVREPVPTKPLVRLFTSGQLEKLTAAIAQQMNLPARFDLAVASKGTRFESHYLARTDQSGRGIEGIEAQVTIPSDLPVFGSAALQRCRISVLVTPSFKKARPETAISILAHELSHVLLYSLRHPRRDNEVFTDLVPIVLGFVDIVRRGRTAISVNSDASGTTQTITTTYGYLSDAEFAFALEWVRSQLSERRRKWLELPNCASELMITVTRARSEIARFEELLHHLDSKVCQVRKADVERIMVVHATDYTLGIEEAIRNALDVAGKAKSYSESVTQYPKHMPGDFHEHRRRCAAAASRLNQVFLELQRDVNLLARNSGIGHRIRSTFAAFISRWVLRIRTQRRKMDTRPTTASKRTPER